MIPKSRPYLSVQELATALKPGAARGRFESAVAAMVGARYGLSFAFAHAGFYALLQVLELKDAEIILPAYTCDVMAEVILHTGNVPVFADIDLAGFNMDLNALRAAITPNTRAIVATHMYGYPADVDAIRSIAGSERITLVEDSTLHLASSVRLRGDAGLFSFGPGKPLYTVRGGVVVTNDAGLFDRLRRFRDAHMSRIPPKEWAKRWLRLMISCLSQSDAGYGLALRAGLVDNGFERSETSIADSYATAYADFQARMGLALLRKADALREDRLACVKRYQRELAGLPGFVPAPIVGGATYSYYTARVHNRDALHFSQRMYARGIHTGRTFDYALPYFGKYRSYARASFPCAERAGQEVVNLPIHTNLTETQSRYIARSVREVLQER